MCCTIRRATSTSKCVRSSRGVAESTNVGDARLGLGLNPLKGDAGDSGTGAVASAEGVGVGVDRVDLGILVLPLNKYFRAHLCSRGFGNENDELS